ncbi:MAG: TonB-dependent receptor [Bacteroidetes bacterium]|nr:TonB-dependent receptor [Bacteroidota bacterium]
MNRSDQSFVSFLRRQLRLTGFLLILVSALPGGLLAGTTGKIAGKATDRTTGEALIGVNIIVEGLALGAATNENGNYTILNLAPGVYTVRASYVGYRDLIIRQVRVSVDQTTRLDISMEDVGVEVEGIVVEASRPLVQKDVTGTQSVVSASSIEELPVQNFYDVLQLQAGVIGSGRTLHVRGGRGNEVAYLVDGVYVVDPSIGGNATNVSNDAIEELNFMTGTFNAEFGNAMSGVVNIVTREGSEKFTGGFEVKTSEFGVDDFSDQHQNYVSVFTGGPIIPGQLTYYLTGTVENNGSYLPFGWDKNRNVLGKLTWKPATTLKTNWSARWSDERYKGYNHLYFLIPERYQQTESSSLQYVGSLTHTLSPTLFYEIRASLFTRDYNRGPDLPDDDILTQGNFFPSSGQTFYERANSLEEESNQLQTTNLRGDVFWQITPTNEIKAGAEARFHRIDYDYTYWSSKTDPETNTYLKYPQEYSAYVQDKIEYDYLIINLGLRFDYFDSQSFLRSQPFNASTGKEGKPKYQLSPRVAIAHPVSDQTVLRFAYGRFIQNPEYRYFFENVSYNLGMRNLVFTDPELDAQRTTAYEVGVVHQVSDFLVASVTGYYKDITGLLGSRFYQMGTFPGQSSAYNLTINEAWANVKGVELKLDMKPVMNLSGSATYTYSVARGSSSSVSESRDPYKTQQIYYLDFDKPHVFNATMTWVPPDVAGPDWGGVQPLNDWRTTLVFRGGSGYPYTPQKRDGGLVAKNSARMPATWQLDAVVSKYIDLDPFRVELFAEITNLTNRKNVLYVYPDTGDPDETFVGNLDPALMKDPSNYAAPRLVRLGLSVTF